MTTEANNTNATPPENKNDGNQGSGQGAASGNSSTGNTETFTKEYVEQLRENAKSERLKREAAEQKAKEKDDAFATLNSKITDLESKSQERIVKAEVKAFAAKAGVIDLDAALKLADMSKVKLNDDQEVTGVEEMLNDLKEKRPYLFQEAKGNQGFSSASDKAAPKKTNDKTPDVMGLNAKDYKERKAKDLAKASKALVTGTL
jgi:hypothetical protein